MRLWQYICLACLYAFYNQAVLTCIPHRYKRYQLYVLSTMYLYSFSYSIFWCCYILSYHSKTIRRDNTRTTKTYTEMWVLNWCKTQNPVGLQELKACFPHWTKGGIVGKSLKTTSRQNPTKQHSMACLLQKRMSSSCS